MLLLAAQMTALTNAVIASCFQSNLMVCGIDVYHDKAASKSVAALVCSMNSSCTRWYSRTCEQMQRQELVDVLKPLFVAAIKKFAEVNVHLDFHQVEATWYYNSYVILLC